MIPPLQQLGLNKLFLSTKRFRRRVSGLLLLFWGGFVAAVIFALFSYSNMNHTRAHAGHIVTLNNAAQQLRQTVSASMINQRSELLQLEKEVQHFRYLLLRTKSYAIEDHWDDIQATLLEADAFVEDVDNLLASIYSISVVTEQLKQLNDSARDPALKGLLQGISSYLLFELQGLNDVESQNRIARFNNFVGELENAFSQMPAGMKHNTLFELYAGLERLSRQLDSVDAVTNHQFVRSITQQQSYWTTRTLLLLDQTMTSMFIAFGFLIGLLFFSFRHGKASSQTVTTTHEDSSDMKTRDSTGGGTFVEPLEPVFEPAVLKEQLEGDNDAMDAVLTMFVAEHQNDAKTLREHVNAGELARARTLIHNIKGVAGNIGAEALQQCCVQVENRLRNGEWIGENDIKQFEKLLCVTIQTVQKEIENANKITAS